MAYYRDNFNFLRFIVHGKSVDGIMTVCLGIMMIVEEKGEQSLLLCMFIRVEYSTSMAFMVK
jgi:hypothetical protein